VGDRVSEGTLLVTLAVGPTGTEPPDGEAAAGHVTEPAAETAAPAETAPAAAASPHAATAPPTEAAAPEAVATAEAAEAAAVTGDGLGAAGPASAGAAPPATGPASAAPPSAGAAPIVGGPPSAAAAPVDEDSFRAAYASPGVRRLARELGVDLSRVTGTGRKGRILKEDVEAFTKAPAPTPAPSPDGAAAADLGLAPWPKVDFAQFGPIERVPLSRIKKISGPNVHRNWVMIPHVTQHDEADITDLEAFRKQTNEAYAKQGVKLTMVALMLKAVIPALKEFPDFNASLDGDELVHKRYYHIGFAADTPQGLVVPVIRDVDQKGLLDLARELTELSGKAREGKLKLGEMQGGTFTISSLGGIGGTAFTPIVNAPEVAILGVSRSAYKPVWDGREFQPRLMVPLSLSYDHRVIDGAAAARFTAYLARVLADLRRALL
jgi:pyruvate dehydrogenase E2 component (dihydrolipoamide acetyltransferase)